MKNKISIVIIGVVRHKNKYLLTYRHGDTEETWANDHWQFPGGSLEYGETPEQTVVRELKEELGINIKIQQLIPKIVTKRRSGWYGVFISFLCTYDGRQKILLNEEASKYGWFKYADLPKIKALPGGWEIAKAAEKCGSERS